MSLTSRALRRLVVIVTVAAGASSDRVSILIKSDDARLPRRRGGTTFVTRFARRKLNASRVYQRAVLVSVARNLLDHWSLASLTAGEPVELAFDRQSSDSTTNRGVHREIRDLV